MALPSQGFVPVDVAKSPKRVKTLLKKPARQISQIRQEKAVNTGTKRNKNLVFPT